VTAHRFIGENIPLRLITTAANNIAGLWQAKIKRRKRFY